MKNRLIGRTIDFESINDSSNLSFSTKKKEKNMKPITYKIIVRLSVDVAVTTEAMNLIDAMKKLEQLKIKDFLTVKGECIDSNYTLLGVCPTEYIGES